jgi:hypothetical protein
MNKINKQIYEFYNFFLGGGAQFSSLPQAQKTLLSALCVITFPKLFGTVAFSQNIVITPPFFIFSQVFPGTFPLEPMANPTTQTSSF